MLVITVLYCISYCFTASQDTYIEAKLTVRETLDFKKRISFLDVIFQYLNYFNLFNGHFSLVSNLTELIHLISLRYYMLHRREHLPECTTFSVLLLMTEMLQSLAQRPAPANTNRERRPRYQHPKGAPNADLIFKTGGR